MIIAVDAAGGDYAPGEIVKGAVEAAATNDVELVLLGEKQVLDDLLSAAPDATKIRTLNAEPNIGCDEHPVQAVRNKPDSSIVRGVRMVAGGSAAAFVSAGNTGAVLAASFLYLKRVEGVERPALGVIIPVSRDTPFLLIDGGANVDCRPGMLLEFARLGSVFARLHLGVASPRIGLLNNGAEAVKGNRLTHEAYRLLKQSKLNFAGNIEGQEIFDGRIDVLVTDGFTGNILLKGMEGFGELIKNFLKSRTRLTAASPIASEPPAGQGDIFPSLIKRLDYSEYGGACLLGLNGNIIVSHGRSSARAITNAIHLARQTAAAGLVDAIRDELKKDLQV